MESIYRKDLLVGKYALITGGGSGIGLEIGKYLVAHGSVIAILGRNLKKLEEAASTFPKNTCHYFQCDIRNIDQISSTVSSILKIFPQIDILINNAAGNFLAPFSKLSTKGFRTGLQLINEKNRRSCDKHFINFANALCAYAIACSSCKGCHRLID